MAERAGKVVTVKAVTTCPQTGADIVLLEEDDADWHWTAGMFEGKIEEEL